MSSPTQPRRRRTHIIGALALAVALVGCAGETGGEARVVQAPVALPAPAPLEAGELRVRASGDQVEVHFSATATATSPVDVRQLRVEVVAADGHRRDLGHHPFTRIAGTRWFEDARGGFPAGQYTAQAVYTLDGLRWHALGEPVTFTTGAQAIQAPVIARR